MSVVYLTRPQLDALVEFTKGHSSSISLEEGAAGESYVTASLMDAEGNVTDSRAWNWEGQVLQRPPAGDQGDETSE